jgi:1,4-alpha-glucan branching enzyme
LQGITGERRGELALVLHTHMPYVLGFGTWPFGEEWLWEAIATCYLPLLDVLGRAPLTLSLTPVLCDQLEAPDTAERCLRFLREIRPESHARDIRQFRRESQRELADELERSAAEYAAAAEQLERLTGRSGGLLMALGGHATWTSAATHPVLPLLATDAGVHLQVQTGIASHRRRFGSWNGGFWLPECAHAQWLHPVLADAGVRAACVELTSLLGTRDPAHLRPIAGAGGPTLWPIDRATMALVWSAGGYPAAPAYRNYHGLTAHHHRVWRNDGAPYDHAAALVQARHDASDFVARVRERVRGGGICVCALDTELLGHWWYEGVHWLSSVLEECERQGLPLTTLDDALERHEPAPPPAELHAIVTSWGEGGDLRTWSAPEVADLAWMLRRAELRLACMERHPPTSALRELLALQSSERAFLAYRELAGEYPRERAAAHAQALERALDCGTSAHAGTSGPLRHLAPEVRGWVS